ncbi:deaminase [Conexibacter woesei]|uniref:CMP/dCMP deaminase zinc-binding protein n=1 Tax=Conexibacter woesei (strain DSM 14684 / CCUG 47730 / CIP 108061 / JCM 11494 / NBRC 100937 / ID131577) TaxID=469383 RepID=D3F7L3_CONWI|nr:nucleoside deaminase [Conexibacter woesei]ADB50875.1 CMP/dCMP deaminase zinc-binding protein [Conexibacter woesei DSM 14684]
MDDVRRRGLERLGALPASELGERLRAFAWTDPADGFVWLSCTLALEAMEAGNYGVGAVLVRDGEVVAEGRNRLLEPYVRTDCHAETEAVDQFEARFRDFPDATGTVLWTSLECCPMCTVRLINTGIREVYYAAPDADGGMLSRWDGLPPFWRGLAARRDPPQRFAQAACAPQLRELAGAIFHASDARLDVRMAAR